MTGYHELQDEGSAPTHAVPRLVRCLSVRRKIEAQALPAPRPPKRVRIWCAKSLRLSILYISIYPSISPDAEHQHRHHEVKVSAKPRDHHGPAELLHAFGSD